jgi:hypothetical protein
MPAREHDSKPFDATPRDELEGYGRDFGIAGTSAMSDTELRKRLRDVEPKSGTAAESAGPVVEKGDPGRGPRNGR